MSRGGEVASAVLMLLAAAAAARPQTPPVSSAAPRERRLSLLAGVFLFDPRLATSYSSSYAPPLEGVPHASRATQTLPLVATHGPGFELGLRRRLGSHWGLEALGDHGASDLTGEPGRYELRLAYTSRPPPSYEPVEVELLRNEARPAATGQLRTWAVAVNVAAWLDAGPHVRLGGSAGPAWLHASGEAQSLVYTSYVLGGHSVLFPEDHLVSFSFSSSGIGLDIGLFLEADLGSRLRAVVDARHFWGPARDAALTLGAVVNADQLIREIPLSEIQARLAPSPVRLDPSFLRVGLSFALGL